MSAASQRRASLRRYALGKFPISEGTTPVLFKLALLLSLCPAALAATRTCIPPQEAARYVNKDTCVAAHVYDVVELSDGTRFLDVCSPDTPDAECRFSIVSRKEDRKEVGDLEQYKHQDIQIRGILRPFNDRTQIFLSRSAQFHRGSEKFRPNPALLKGFSGDDHPTAFTDPNLRSSRHRGALTKPQ